jgi:predicted GH43/DUF377 family glycosyl hydrolase
MRWGEPVIVLGPNPKTDWEHDINRPIVVKCSDGYHMWYTGQARGHSYIGYAKSSNGRDWNRVSGEPVISSDSDWEKVAVMCPHVIWDGKAKLFHMWYSGGEQYEPDAIGYATSPDGIRWKKLLTNPIFRPNPDMSWEKCKVAACQVIKHSGWYYMFYVGFHDVHLAQIGIARSRDGTSNWERHPFNPIIRPSRKDWDRDACYKPFAIYDNQQWMLWYNGRRSQVEQIGLAIHKGEDLGF